MPKRITITLDDEIVAWLDKKIDEKIFHNYQHAAVYCISQLVNENLVILPGDLPKRIDMLIESGKLGFVDRQSFVLECIRKKLEESGIKMWKEY